ncbi:hypothetical protein D3C80_2166040 [compost metagenome]
MIIGSYGQRIDLILLLHLGCQENDADSLIRFSDSSAYLETINTWHHHIQKGNINIRHRIKDAQRLIPIC